MNLFSQGIALMNKIRDRHAAEDAIYCRGVSRYPCRATPGSTEFDAGSEYGGIRVTAQSRDFLILRTDLEFDPAAGDVIIWQGRCYEVVTLGDQRCWGWSDSLHTTYRIHTKDIGPET